MAAPLLSPQLRDASVRGAPYDALTLLREMRDSDVRPSRTAIRMALSSALPHPHAWREAMQLLEELNPLPSRGEGREKGKGQEGVRGAVNAAEAGSDEGGASDGKGGRLSRAPAARLNVETGRRVLKSCVRAQPGQASHCGGR